MHQVRIELVRIQTFLFAAPRLRAMIGANALLGEVLREALPRLARAHGAGIDRDVTGLPGRYGGDPLICPEAEDLQDDLQKLVEGGILARDGGHFAALFPDAPRARRFVQAAETLLREELPGLGFTIRDGPFEDDVGSASVERSEAVLDLPQFQVCEMSGNGPAACRLEIGSDRVHASAAMRRRQEAGARFADRESWDVIGLMQDHLPLSDRKAPEDFHELCDGEYLAVVHADGNGVGARCGKRDLVALNDVHLGAGRGDAKLKQEIGRQIFFHGMRGTVRRAVADALAETFETYKGRIRPYQLLMLGGDDLLLVCRARYALRFVRSYAQKLANDEAKLPDGRPLTIGAGVVIAAPTVPFHRLHAVAEALASSAKRLYRALPEESRASVVDWMVTTDSWSEDPVEVRRRDSIVRYRVDGRLQELVLTGKPYRVLGVERGLEGPSSLEGLLAARNALRADPAKREDAARSQLRWLVDELPRGRHWSSLSFEELPGATREALRRAGIKNLWSSEEGRSVTRLGDLVEISEIARLGVKNRDEEEP